MRTQRSSSAGAPLGRGTAVRERPFRIASMHQSRGPASGRPPAPTAWQTSPVGQIRKRLTSIAEHLGHDELAVLILVAERLRGGRRIYGELHLATDTRNFARQALEEAADLAVYAAAGLISTRQPRGHHDRTRQP